MQRYTVYFIWKLLYMFRLVPPPIIRSAKELYLQHLVFVTPLLLSDAIVEELELRSSNSFTIASDSSNGVTNTRCCRYSCFALLMMGGGNTRNM
jgi:hypothetical protein